MKLSFITDEATQSFHEAVAFARENALQGLELRTVEGFPIDLVPQDTLRCWRVILDGEGLFVSCLAASFCKCLPETREKEGEKLLRLCDAADILGTDLIRGFAFFTPKRGALPPRCLAALLAPHAALLKRRGKRLLLEPDPAVNTTNHAGLAEVLALLDPDAFGAVYDPGSAFFDPRQELPFPDGYEVIRGHMRHIHVKDTVLDGTCPRCVPPGEGLVGWPRLLAQLQRDGYSGWLSLEPHYQRGIPPAARQRPLPAGAEFPPGSIEAARESAEALHTLLRDLG